MKKKTDPPVRKECAQCGEPRKEVKSHPAGIDPDVYKNDPFCSATCCRDWYDSPIGGYYSGDPAEKRGRHSRQPLTRCE